MGLACWIDNRQSWMGRSPQRQCPLALGNQRQAIANRRFAPLMALRKTGKPSHAHTWAKGRTGGEHASRLSAELGESLNNVCSRCTSYGNAMRIALLWGRSFSTSLISHSKCFAKKCAGSLTPFFGTLSLGNQSRPEMQQAGAARPAKAIRFCASLKVPLSG
jgi:hypothetical protein